MSSCVRTTARRSGLHVAAPAGSRITGRHSPPVIGVATASPDSSRTSRRRPSRRCSVAAARTHSGSRTGRAVRTSFRSRSAANASEARERTQPTSHTIQATRTTECPMAALAALPAASARVSSRARSARTRASRIPATSSAAIRPEGARAGSKVAEVAPSIAAAGDSPLRAGRSGISHEGPKRPRTGSARTRANVAVHSRCRVLEAPRRINHASASASRSRSVTWAISTTGLNVPPPPLSRSSPGGGRAPPARGRPRAARAAWPRPPPPSRRRKS